MAPVGVPPLPKAASTRVVSRVVGATQHLPPIHVRTRTPPRFRNGSPSPMSLTSHGMLPVQSCHVSPMTPRRVQGNPRIQSNGHAADGPETPAKEVMARTLQRRLEESNSSCADATAVSEHHDQELLMLKSDFAAAQDAWQAQQREAEAMVAQLKQELATLKANSEQVQQSRSQDEVIVGTLQRRLEEANASCAEAAAVSEHRYQELLMLKSDFAAAQDAWQAQQREAEAVVAQLMQELATLKANSEQVQVQQSRSQDEVIVGTRERTLEEANAPGAEAEVVLEHRHQANLEQAQQSAGQDQVLASAPQERLDDASRAEAAAVGQDPNSAPNEGSISTGVQMSSTSGTPTSAAPTLLTEQRRRPSQALKDCAQSGSLCREVQATDGGLWQCEGVLNFGLSGEAKARLKASNRQAEEDADRSKELAEELRAKYRQHYGHEPKDGAQLRSFASRLGHELPFRAAARVLAK